MTAKEYLFSELEKKNLHQYFTKEGKLLGVISGIMEGYAKIKYEQPKLSLEERKQKFIHSIEPFIDQYGKPMCLSFYNYWSELNNSGKKMRFEFEKTWEVGKRLATWSNNQKTFNNGKQDKRTELDNLEQQLIAKFGG